MRSFALLVLILLLIGGAVWWEVSLWNECRATHSWFYCVRVLNH